MPQGLRYFLLLLLCIGTSWRNLSPCQLNLCQLSVTFSEAVFRQLQREVGSLEFRDDVADKPSACCRNMAAGRDRYIQEIVFGTRKHLLEHINQFTRGLSPHEYKGRIAEVNAGFRSIGLKQRLEGSFIVDGHQFLLNGLQTDILIEVIRTNRVLGIVIAAPYSEKKAKQQGDL